MCVGGGSILKSLTFFLTKTGTPPLQTKSAIYFLTLSNNHISECEKKSYRFFFYEFYHDDDNIFFFSLENFFKKDHNQIGIGVSTPVAKYEI